MVHFLRDAENNTLIECEVYDTDLSAAVYLETYSYHLLERIDTSVNIDARYDFISDFEYLNEIRRAWWEDDPGVQTPEEFVTEQFARVAKKWNLYYVTD
jgi:hypothetical protein